MLNLSHSTIKLYLAAVRFHYIKAGVPNPLCSATDTCVRLQTVMRGIQKQKCTKEKRRPITYSVLVQIHNALKRGIFGVFLDTMLGGSQLLQLSFIITSFGHFTHGQLAMCYYTLKELYNVHSFCY